MRKFIVGLLGALGVVVLSAGQAGAAPILACPAGEDCNGATVGAELFDLGGTNYRIDVVFDFTGYTGNTTDVLHAVQIKSFSTGVMSGTSVAFSGTASPGTSWALYGNELNANKGCGGGSGGEGRLCAEANDAAGAGALVYDSGSYLQATFSFFFSTSGNVGSSLHLKFLYEDLTGKKVGDLGSFDLKFSKAPDPEPDPDPNPDPDPVPEPVTVVLLGAGLLGVATRSMRRRA